MLKNGEKMAPYRFEGYWKDVGTLDSLWDANMDMLAQGSGLNLLDKDWPIYARAESEPPAYLGETAEVGDDCLIYHGVTLGGTGKDQGKRHPTIGNNVLLSTGSKVLGPFKVGDGARIAANAVVLKEVPEDATAVGVPARVVRIAGEKTNFVGDVDQVSVPDPVQKELDAINSRLSWLEEYLDKKHEEEENKRKENQQNEAV